MPSLMGYTKDGHADVLQTLFSLYVHMKTT